MLQHPTSLSCPSAVSIKCWQLVRSSRLEDEKKEDEKLNLYQHPDRSIGIFTRLEGYGGKNSGLVVEHRKQLKINEKKSTFDAIIVRINDMKICPRVQMSFLRFKRSRQRIRI